MDKVIDKHHREDFFDLLDEFRRSARSGTTLKKLQAELFDSQLFLGSAWEYEIDADDRNQFIADLWNAYNSDNDKAVKEFMKKWAEKGSRVTAAEVAKSLR